MTRLGVAAALAMSVSAADAATVVFSDDFSSGTASSQFSGVTTVEGVQGYAGQGGFADSFLRNSTGDTSDPAPTTLTLTGLETHTLISITFDLAIIDSWDGNEATFLDDFQLGPDSFSLSLDGSPLYQSSFGFSGDALGPGTTQTVGSAQLGFNFDFEDRGFSVSLTFAHASSMAVFDFVAGGDGWQGGLDESWAIDNLVVSTAVPVPPLVPVFLATLIATGLFFRRRGAGSTAGG